MVIPDAPCHDRTMDSILIVDDHAAFRIQAHALLEQNANPSEHEIRLWLAGNLCRCTGYDKIVRAVQAAAKQRAR